MVAERMWPVRAVSQARISKSLRLVFLLGLTMVSAVALRPGGELRQSLEPLSELGLSFELPHAYSVIEAADVLDACLYILEVKAPRASLWVLAPVLMMLGFPFVLRRYARSLNARTDPVELRRRKQMLGTAAPGLLPKLRYTLARHPMIELHPAERTAVHVQMVPHWLGVDRRRRQAAKKVVRELQRLDSLDARSRRVAGRLAMDLAAESSRRARALVVHAVWRKWRSLQTAMLLFVLWGTAAYLIVTPLLRQQWVFGF